MICSEELHYDCTDRYFKHNPPEVLKASLPIFQQRCGGGSRELRWAGLRSPQRCRRPGQGPSAALGPSAGDGLLVSGK